jgi:hypothetical protein
MATFVIEPDVADVPRFNVLVKPDVVTPDAILTVCVPVLLPIEIVPVDAPVPPIFTTLVVATPLLILTICAPVD